ncbi:MAG: c-type cytochrome, partial [Acidobacteriota bacterium]
MVSSLNHLVISFGVIILLLFVFLLWKTDKFSFTNSIILLIAIFVFFGAFEFLREAGRKPFIIKDYMYSNAIRVDQVEKMEGESFLKHSKWVKNKEVTEDNEIEAGGEIFRTQCYACHSLGIKNNINKKAALWDLKKIRRIVGSLKGITPFMTGFVGTEEEKNALAKWLWYETHEGEPVPGEDSSILSGEKLFENYCSDCHETETDDPALSGLNKAKNLEEIMEILGRLDILNEDMPPFEGSEEEKKILAEYLDKLRSKK